MSWAVINRPPWVARPGLRPSGPGTPTAEAGGSRLQIGWGGTCQPVSTGFDLLEPGVSTLGGWLTGGSARSHSHIGA